MSVLQQYAEAIYKAQADRDRKVLEIICKKLGVDFSPIALVDHKHRISKHVIGANRSESFFVDGEIVAFATQPTCEQGVGADGLFTVTATYHLSDETLRK